MSGEPAAPLPLKLFISYAHEDSRLRARLAKHLALLKNRGVLASWYDGEIVAGQEWEAAIFDQLNTADIILLLISADFLASPYCYGREMQRALERHDAKEARVIPVLLQPVDDFGHAPFAKLQAVPIDANKRLKAVTEWPHRERAYAKIAEGIRQAADQLLAARGNPSLAH